MLVIVVGQTFHGSIAPAPVDHTPPRQPPSVTTTDRSLYQDLLHRRRKVAFPLEVPRLIEKSSSLASDTPIRTYRIDGKDRALRMTFQLPNSLEYWGIQETNWQDAPVLADRNFDHKIRGRDYSFYWNGSNLHMVVLHENGATYWVINTLLDTLSPQTMVAIAKSLAPLPEPKKR